MTAAATNTSIIRGGRTRQALGEEAAGPSATLLRLGAAAGALGAVVQIVAEVAHPSGAHPNDSAAAFFEYAASSNWTAVHLAQFAGVLLITIALLALYRSLPRTDGAATAAAHVGALALGLVVAVFAVTMAVDGVALKAAVDAWVSDGASTTSISFEVAESVRWVERGLVAFFQLTNGVAMLSLGAALALGTTYRRWLGWFGIAGGLGMLAGGTTTAHTGFSDQAGTVLLPAFALATVFITGACISMWRRSRSVTAL